ncbi:MAG TPA: trehalose-phosphatase [Acidimicrobiia bacterium]|nr:trehalose-phosphatase [Acidimicrobiia bacterium]
MTIPDALAPITADPGSSAVVTDFDGTLAPIVDDPARARALPAALEALAALVAPLALVAVVSGRPVTFLRAQVPVPGVELVGVYGLERLVGGEPVTDERAAPFVDAVVAAAREAERRWPRLSVERKGTVAFTVHWRVAPEAAPAWPALEQLAGAHGLSLGAGRRSAELRVPVPVDKGGAMTTLLDERRVHVGVFAGDDAGDLPAFDALARRAVERPGFTSIRVAVDSDEAPPSLIEEADLVVGGPAGLAALLGALTAGLRPRA